MNFHSHSSHTSGVEIFHWCMRFWVCCGATVLSGFLQDLKEKYQQAAGKAVTETYFCHGKITFSFFSPPHLKNTRNHVEQGCFLPKRPVQFPKQRSLDSSHKLWERGWISRACLNPTEPFEGLPIIKCYSLTYQHRTASEYFLCVS